MKAIGKRVQKIEDQTEVLLSKLMITTFVSFVKTKDDPPPDGWALSVKGSPIAMRITGESCEALKERAVESARKIEGEAPVLVLFSA